MESYPRETIEYVFPNVLVDGQPVTVFDYAVSPTGERPTTWQTAGVVDDRPAFLLDASTLGRGDYKVWVRVTDTPEVVVIQAGSLSIT